MSESRRWSARLLRQAWSGLVALGTVHLGGEMCRAQCAFGSLLMQPPAGHPERLCPEVPLTALEQALIWELRQSRVHEHWF